MTNPSTDDLVRAAFTDLRRTESGRVIPPGAAAARRTVRRRRGRAVTAAGAASAVVALGIGYLATGVAGQADPSGTLPGATGLPSPPASTPGPLPSTEPPDPGGAGDHGGENAAEAEALDAVDFDTEDGKWLPGLSLNDSQQPPGSLYHMFFVDAGEPAWHRELLDTADPRVAAESYLVQVWCGDEFGGSATVTLRAGIPR